MRRIWLLTLKDFKRKWKNPVVIVGFLMIPLLFTFLFGFIFGSSGEETLPSIKVLAVDNDDSLLSRLYLGAFTQGELKEMLNLETAASEEKARHSLDQGKASALIIIPDGFGDAVWKGEETEITLIKNPSEEFLPQVAEEISSTTALIFSGLLQVFSDELDQIRQFTEMNENIPDRVISSISIQMKERMEGIEKYIFPPVISIKQTARGDTDENQSSGFSIHSYILPAISIMFVLFICNIVFEDLLREKEKGTLLRMSISPMQISEFVWSKILTSLGIGIICTLLLVGLGSLIFSIYWGNLGFLISIILSLNILIAGFIAFLYIFIRTERQAGALMSSVIVVMALLGGSMTPVQNFPPFVQKISQFTINYWGLEAFHRNILGESPGEIWTIIIGMLTIGIVLAVLSSTILKTRLKKGLYR